METGTALPCVFRGIVMPLTSARVTSSASDDGISLEVAAGGDPFVENLGLEFEN